MEEQAASKELEGAKVQLAQVFGSFMEYGFKATPNQSLEEAKSNLLAAANS